MKSLQEMSLDEVKNEIKAFFVEHFEVEESALFDNQTLLTVNGNSVIVTITNDGVFIDDAQVIVADLEADNGVVHVIDAVMLPQNTIADVVINSENHNTLEIALQAAGFLDDLRSDEDTLTLFAPTDEAFSVLPQEVIDQLLANPQGQLSTILLHHLTIGAIESSTLSNQQVFTSLIGYDNLVTINNDGVFINDAQVTMADIMTDNGIVHVIDAILVPTSIESVLLNSTGFSTLVTALDQAGFLADLGSPELRATLFAPTDDAFDALPDGVLEEVLADPELLENILAYHVVDGRVFSNELSDGQVIETVFGDEVIVTINNDGIFINDAEVIIADVFTGNGIIHAIDAVLLPQGPTVADIVIESEDHTILETALIEANLVETLQGEGPFTVFAPTDEAFGLLPEGTLETLLEDPEGALTDILLYHVVGGFATSDMLADGQTITTVLTEDVTVTIENGNVFINDAQVVVADLIASNGVVHVIDMVLLPPTNTTDLPETASAIYPNPAKESFVVDYDNSLLDNPNLYIINSTGQVVKFLPTITSGQGISINELNAGMYQIRLSDEQSTVTKRLIKM